MNRPARSVRARFWVQIAFAVAAFVLMIITLVTREWIEFLTGWDPDHGNGSLEWILVAVLAAVALVLAVLARQEWRRPRAVTSN